MKSDEVGATSEPAKFRINSSYQGFTSRQKSVFDQLNIAEHSTRNLLSQNNAFMDVDDSDSKDDVSETSEKEIKFKKFQGKESIFKKPQARPPRGMINRKVPDFRMNPHKWTRYSLDDVKSEDMSDRANTAAAMSFLKEMESRKRQDEENMLDGDAPQKVVFKKYLCKTGNERVVKTGTTTTIFQNSKVVMPEYVVGQKIKKEQKRKDKKIGSSITSKEIKLGHLHEDAEDDEDN